MAAQPANDEPPQNWMDGLLWLDDKFQEENEDLEAILEGDLGFHAFFTRGGPDPTRGVQTAVYQGIYDQIQELSVDEEIVEMHYGELTPETVWQAVEDQIHEFTYLPESLFDPIEERVKERVEKNLESS